MGLLIAVALASSLPARPAIAEAPYYTLDVGEATGGTPSVVYEGTHALFYALVQDALGDPVADPATVYMELIGGPNDPDPGAARPFDTPDAGCVIPAGEYACGIEYEFGLADPSPSVHQIVFWINGRRVDTLESAAADAPVSFDRTQGCVDGTPDAADPHRDGTDVVSYVVVFDAMPTAPGPRHPIPQGAIAPPVCPEGGPVYADDRL